MQLRTGIRSIRRTFAEISKTCKLDEQNVLTVDGLEIGFVYYRCGYNDSQYNTEEDWTARLNLELSQAIKLPSIDL